VSVFCAGVAFTFTLGISCVHEYFRADECERGEVLSGA
jgi:hypothetical protein